LFYQPSSRSNSGYLSLDVIANNIASATFNVINDGKVRTADMGGSATTSEFTSAIIDKL
jgi:isocitrate dehydrogenase (NAD+)